MTDSNFAHCFIIKNLAFNKILQWQVRCEFFGGAMLIYGITHKLFSAKLKLF